MGYLFNEANLLQVDEAGVCFTPLKDLKSIDDFVRWADKLHEHQTKSITLQLAKALKDRDTALERLKRKSKTLSHVIKVIEYLQPCEFCIHRKDDSKAFKYQGGCHACKNHGADFFKLDKKALKSYKED